MTFPATQQVLDDFNRADGGLGGNWVNAYGSAGCTISTRRASGAASAWAVPMATGAAVYCRMALMPSVSFTRLSLSSDLGGTARYSVTLNADTSIGLATNVTSSASGGLPIVAGSWFGMWWDGAQLHGYYAQSVGGPWTQALAPISGSLAPQGWWAVLDSNDAAAKIDLFGAETLPGGTPPVIHGRGAC